MTSEVILANSKSYFNMKKFEDSILNKGIERQKKLLRRRVLRIVDIILVFIMLVLIFFLLFEGSRLLYSRLKVFKKDKNIENLNIMLRDKVNENDELLLGVNDRGLYEDIRTKAYLELNMITPTEKNIIYFDRTDSEYVRQYENIK